MRHSSNRILTTHVVSLERPADVVDLLWAKERREAYDTGVFETAVSPSDVEGQQPNQFSKTPEEFLHAIADAMHDEYRAIVDIMLEINAGAYLFETGNPRHEHEWTVWERVNVPDGKILVPGVISHSTPLAEGARIASMQLGA